MRNMTLRATVLLVSLISAATLASTHTAAAQGKRVYIPAGTRVLVRMVDSIDSSQQKAGYRFTATLETNLQMDNRVVAPRGTTVYGQLITAEKAGRMSGGANLTLELTDIVINGTAYPLLTSDYTVESIGGLAGGGTGAAIGVAAGAAGGTALSAAGKGQQVAIPSESLLEFRLEQPASLPVAR